MIGDDYSDVIRKAIEALASNGPDAARVELEPAAGLIWNERLSCRRRTHKGGALQREPRSYKRSRAAATFARDRFLCQYCGRRVTARPLAVLLHDIDSPAIAYNVHYSRGLIHPLFWTNVAEADHRVPGSAGGSWHDLSNHVTACVCCNATKSDSELEFPVFERNGWDGMVPSYRAAWERAGRPRAHYHSSWIRTLESALKA